jgi:hypothetical protein
VQRRVLLEQRCVADEHAVSGVDQPRRWLGDRISVDQVNVTSEPGFENQVTIESFTRSSAQQRQSLQAG